MYDELVKRLRETSCGAKDTLWWQATDAIEELSAIREEQKAQIIAMAAEDKPRWIPVTERVPFDGGKYLCKIKCPKGEWIEIDHWDGEDWYSTGWHEARATDVVTHWMPLPQPPEEE